MPGPCAPGPGGRWGTHVPGPQLGNHPQKPRGEVNTLQAPNELIFIKLTLYCIITFPNIRSFHINIYNVNVIRIKSDLCDCIHLFLTLLCFKDKSWLWDLFYCRLEVLFGPLSPAFSGGILTSTRS